MRLYGYSNPTGRFPSAVVPVWINEANQLFGAYTSSTKRGGTHRLELKAIQQEGVEQLPAGWIDRSIGELQPQEVSLIALSAKSIIAFPVASEVRMITELLRDPSFASEQPFTRLAFARLTASIHLVATELLSAASFLLAQEVGRQGGARARIENWLEQEHLRLADALGSTAEGAQFLAELPTTLQALGSLVWWRGHTAVLPPAKPLSLLAIEDRKPSPKTAAILTIEPVVPDRPILNVMGRHIYNGTNYVFFHDPSASSGALDRLHDAALSAVAQAKKAATGPLSKLMTPMIGDVKFFSLAERWTGSPYVFYEEAIEGGTTVVGYRGLDVGAAIARSYERLPDQIAFELLEALTSGAPKPVAFDAQHPGPVVLDIEAARKRKHS